MAIYEKNMSIDEQRATYDRVLKKLAERSPMMDEELVPELMSGERLHIIGTLKNEGLIKETEIYGNPHYALTSDGEVYAKRGYNRFLKDRKRAIQEPLKYYRTTRHTAVWAIIIAGVSMIISLIATAISLKLINPF